MKTIFKAYHNVDTLEGKGPMRTIAHFYNKADAERAAKEFGSWFMGGDPTGQVDPVRVYETYDEFLLQYNQDLAAQAKRKLTTEELKALGL